MVDLRTNGDESSGSSVNWTMSALLVSIFITQVDQTIVSTALPTIVSELQGLRHMSWIFTVYMLASTAMMPIAGKLSDLFGRKNFYMLGLLLFMAGSALCGAAGSMAQLIAFRGIQGIGAGFMIPITFTLVFSLMPREKAGKYQTFYMSVFALSSIVGPSLGALITERLDWRWAFYLNLPIGLYVFFVLNRCLREKRRREGKPAIDAAGAILLVATTLSVLLALKLGGERYAWLSPPIVGLLAIGAAGLAAFVLVEKRAREPILPPALFRGSVVSGSLAATFLQGMIMYGALLYIPLFVQGSMGGDVGDAGNSLTPMMFSIMVGAAFGNVLLKRWTYRAGIALAMLLAGAGMAGMVYMPLDAGFWEMAAVMLLVGTGIGILMPLAQLAVTFGTEERFKGVATSTVGFSRAVGGVFGSAVLAAILNGRMASAADELAPAAGAAGADASVLADPQRLLSMDSSLPEETARVLREALAGSLQAGFWFLAAVAALGVAAAAWTGNGRYETASEKPSGAAAAE